MVEDPPFLIEISNLSMKPEEGSNENVPVNGMIDVDYMMGAEELREARIRAAQMEKTVQWWSECTANWREKWSSVKNERNKARDEIKILKSKLDVASEEMYKMKRERNEFSDDNTKLQKDVERMEAELRRDRRAFVPPLRVIGERNDIIAVKTAIISETPKNDDEQKKVENFFDDKISEEVMIEAVEKNENKKQIFESAQESYNVDKKAIQQDVCKTCAEVREEITVVKAKLENAEKTILEEKSSKESLSDKVDELTADIEQLKGSIQEEQLAKDKAISELKSFKEEKPKKLTRSISESCTKNGEDRKVKDLRVEIEKLQKENAAEWSKREKLETEKLAAIRESKKLRHQVEDLTKELGTKMDETTKAASFDMKQIQKELDEKKKELTDLKTSHMKLKKVYQDKKEDVLHTKTRADNHEDEIKKLRTRVDELKQKLTTTEDELDQKDNLSRKLERSLDEETQQCHVLQVQLEHLQSRWKKMTSMARIPRRENDTSQLSEDERRFMSDDEF